MRTGRIMASRHILGPNGKPFEFDRNAARQVRGSYDAAQTTTLNVRHWAATDALSADEANSYSVRKTLRERARLEVCNSPFLAGLVDTFALDVVGAAGPDLQVLLPHAPKIAQDIERRFAQWAKAVRLGSKLRTMERARLVDGEAFALLNANENVKHPVKMDLRLMECDRVHKPSINLNGDETNIDGVVIDDRDNVIRYEVLSQHPGGLNWAVASEYEKYDPEWILHWFGRERPEQHRGVSELKASLQIVPLFRRYLLAVVQSAEFAAEINGVLSVDAPASQVDEEDALNDFDAFAPERGFVWVAPYGYKLNQIDPKQPPATLPDFRREIWSESALPQHMPRNIAMADSSTYNFASGRLDHGTYFKGIGVRQGDMGLEVADPIFAPWLRLARTIWRWAIPEEVDHEWLWQQRNPIDPREAGAEVERIAAGISTLPESYAARGLDCRVELEKGAEALNMTLEEYQRRIADKLFATKQANNGDASAQAEASADLESEIEEIVHNAMSRAH